MLYRISAVALALAACAWAPARAADMVLTETGSSLVKPLLDILVPEYTTSHPGVQIKTASTGSEAGVAQALAGQVMIGTSDAYMADSQVRANPDFVNVPLAISAQTINYNIPQLNGTNLRLDGSAIAGIYKGTIRQWDDPAIAAMNPGVALPHQPIIALHRTDGSGDTFVFTQFLSFATATEPDLTSSGIHGVAWDGDSAVGTSISWPGVPGAVGVAGNEGMEKALQTTPYAIGYLGVSYSAQIAADKLGTAMLKNEAGKFLLPSARTILAGAESLGVRTPRDERLTLVYGPGDDSYPLVNYEYAVVSTKQSDPQVAAALRRFLLWVILPSEERADDLEKVNFVPLPPHIWELSQAQIGLIK